MGGVRRAPEAPRGCGACETTEGGQGGEGGGGREAAGGLRAAGLGFHVEGDRGEAAVLGADGITIALRMLWWPTRGECKRGPRSALCMV